MISKLQGWKKMIIDTKNSNVDKARKYRAERTANPADVVVAVAED